jgi:hypothetical protein
MSYDNLSSVSQNVLKIYQQFTGEETSYNFVAGGITNDKTNLHRFASTKKDHILILSQK